MDPEMSGLVNLKKGGALFGKIVYVKMYCDISKESPRALNMYTSEKRKHPPYRKIVFQALSHVKIPSEVDVKNADAIDLIPVETIGGKAKGDKVYTLRPCDGDQLFFDKIRRLSQAKGEDFEQMPNDDDEIDRLYEQVLDIMAIPERVRESMMSLPNTNKWKQICLHKDNIRSDQSFRDEAKQWANRLASYDKGVLSSEEASRLATTVRTSPRVWLESFHDFNGIKALFIDQLAVIQLGRTRTTETVTVLMHMMDALKSLMNTQMGMNNVLDTPKSVETIVMCLDLNMTKNLELSKAVLELLTVLCFYHREPSDYQGRDDVFDGLCQFYTMKDEETQFRSITVSLALSNDLDYNVKVVSFINELLFNSIALEERVPIREKFIKDGFLKICDDLKEQYAGYEHGSLPHDKKVAYNAFLRAVGVFEKVYQEDQEEVACLEFPLLSPEDIFNALQKASLQSNDPKRLSNLLHHLSFIPGDRTFGAKTWNLITDAVKEIVKIPFSTRYNKVEKQAMSWTKMMEQLVNDSHELHGRLNEHAKMTQKMEFQRRRIEQLEREMDEKVDDAVADQRLVWKMEFEEKIKALEMQHAVALATATANAVNTSVATPAKSTGHPPPPPGMSPINAPPVPALPPGVGNSPSFLAAPGLPPPPPGVPALPPGVAATAGAPPPPPGMIPLSLGFGTPPAPPGLMSAPPLPPGLVASPPPGLPPPPMGGPPMLPPPPMGGPPMFPPPPMGGPPMAPPPPMGGPPMAPPPPMGGPPMGPPPPMGGPPMAPPPPMGGRRQKKPKKKVPPKKAHLRKFKIKQLYWKAIKPEKYKGTFWGDVKDASFKKQFNNLDQDHICHFFGTMKKNKKTIEDNKDKTKEIKKKKKALPKADVIESERNRKVALGIGRLKQKPEVLARAIMMLDTNIVRPELSSRMFQSNLFPTKAESNALKDYYEKEGTKGMNKVELFFFALVDIPRIDARLECMHRFYSFGQDFEEVKGQVATIYKATKQVMNSKRFGRLLEIILAVGNFMNGKTRNGGAFGFQLSSLSKLKDTKSINKPPISLLQWIVGHITDKLKEPDLLRLVDEWSAVPKCTRLYVSEIEKYCMMLESGLVKIKREIDEPHKDTNDRFVAVMKPFYTRCQKHMATLNAKKKQMMKAFNKMYEYYGMEVEGRQDSDVAEFWEVLSTFPHDLVQAKVENELVAAKLLKAQKELERKQAMKAKRVQNRKRREKGVFERYAEARAGDVDEIVARFKKNKQASQEASRQRGRGRNRRASQFRSKKKVDLRMVTSSAEPEPKPTPTRA